MQKNFQKMSNLVSNAVGSSYSFLFAFMIVMLWAVTGPLFDFSNTWQLVINTGTTIVTFLMVFLIQNTQNRDARAMHLKIDELIRVSSKARNTFIELQKLSDEELAQLDSDFERISKEGKSVVVNELHEKIKEEKERRHLHLPTIGNVIKKVVDKSINF